MNTRRLFVYCGLLLLLVAGSAFAGRFQRTKDGKTLVWNDNPKARELVTWSGARDAQGYATGYGTLTWYRPQNVLQTGSNIPAPRRHIIASRVSGVMVHGKFEETPAPEKAKKKAPARSSPKPAKTPSARPKETPEKAKPTPTPEEKPSPKVTPSPTATPSSSPTNESLDSLMHAPSSLKLGSPVASPSPALSSPAGSPDVSLQLGPSPSPSPSP